MKPQLSPKLAMKTAHIWNPLASTHASIPRSLTSLTSSFHKWKKPTLSTCQDSSGSHESGQNQNQAPSLTPQTLMLKSNMFPVLTLVNKIKLGRQTKKNVSCQKLLECKWIVPFTTIPSCKQVTCPYIPRTIACTGDGGKKRISLALSFRATLEIVRVQKFLLLLMVGTIQCK